MQTSARTHSLASCYENAFTIILRLTSLQQQSAANSQDFRTSIRAALKAAMEQAKISGILKRGEPACVLRGGLFP